MRSKVVNVAAALGDEAPFLPGYTVTVLNLGAATDRLESSDTIGGTYTVLAEIPSNEAVDVVLDKPFVRSEDLGNGKLVLLGN